MVNARNCKIKGSVDNVTTYKEWPSQHQSMVTIGLLQSMLRLKN